MAQFKPFVPNVEVLGQAVLGIVYGVSDVYQEKMLNILAKYGIMDPQADTWYPQEAWLKAFEEISNTIGIYTLFAIGKAMPEKAKFPPDIQTLEDALKSIDTAYQLNHRGGDSGYYRLISYDAQHRKAVMECRNPYPCHFDRGIILSLVRKFKPRDSYKQDVILDLNKECRLDGGDSSTYIISW